MNEISELITSIVSGAFVVGMLVAVFTGKGKQVVDIMRELNTALSAIPKIIPSELQGSGYVQKLNEIQSKITDSTRLTRDIVDDCVTITSAGEVKVNKTGILIRAATSGDAKKVANKVGKSLKNLKKRIF